MKILPLEKLADRIHTAQNAGQTIVLCHGCFDLVHPGHIRHLRDAARHGDHLVVTLTGDEDVNKGAGRPLIPQELRAENLAALDCVDWVAINPEPTAINLLTNLRPDVYIKGREYENNLDRRFAGEKEVCRRLGIRVIYSSGDVVFSSSALISAMEDAAGPSHSRLKQLLRQHELTASSIDQLIASFAGKRVVVVGEIIIDTYIMCDRPVVSGEAPVMTLRPIESRSFDGGAAIIARHFAAMGAMATIVTALPDSPDARRLISRLESDGIEVRAVECDVDVIEKQRFLVGNAKVMKLDPASHVALDADRQKRMIRCAVDASKNADAIIIADYGQKLFSGPMVKSLCRKLRTGSALLVGDISGRHSNLLAMRGMDLLCPSELEMRDALRDYDEGLTSVVWEMLRRTQSKSAIVTLGGEGLIAFQRRPDSDASPKDWRNRLTAEHIPAMASHAVDELGCGDALLAAATLTTITRHTPALAGLVGSVAAAAESQRLGNIPIGAAELRLGLRRLLEQKTAMGTSIEMEVKTQLHQAIVAME